MYGHKNHNDPSCAKICTGFIITFADFPVFWIPKFQTETFLSTTESEIIFLAHFFRELFPIIDITQSLGKSVGLPVGVTSIKVFSMRIILVH